MEKIKYINEYLLEVLIAETRKEKIFFDSKINELSEKEEITKEEKKDLELTLKLIDFYMLVLKNNPTEKTESWIEELEKSQENINYILKMKEKQEI